MAKIVIRVNPLYSNKSVGTSVTLDDSHTITKRRANALLDRLIAPVGDDLLSGRYIAWWMIDGKTERIEMERTRDGGIKFLFPSERV